MPRLPRKSTISVRIDKIAARITDLVNESKILDSSHILLYNRNLVSNGISVQFFIVKDDKHATAVADGQPISFAPASPEQMDDYPDDFEEEQDSHSGEVDDEDKAIVPLAYARAVFDREPENNYKKEGSEQGIYSGGNYMGSFLFFLLLWVVITESISDFKLDNYTNNPARATKLIYKRFIVDRRGVDRKDFVGKTLAERLLVSEGKMRFIVNRNSKKEWEEDMRALGNLIVSSTVPWNDTVSEKIEIFLSKLKQLQGGNKKSKQKRKSKRKKRSRRTRRRKRTKTRRRRKK